MKKLSSLFLMALLPLMASAYDAEVDGIYYNLNANTKQATVTYRTSDDFYSQNQDAYAGNVNIPERVTYNGITYSVTSIGEAAFGMCSKLTSVTIPNSVTSIGEAAFGMCSGLTSVTIPNSVTEIGENAFYGCYIEHQKFINNSTLDAEANNYWGATIVDSKENGFMIKDDILIRYTGNEASVTIPNSVTTIGERAFSGNSRLTSITIPNSVTSIGNYAFSECSGLTSVTIPNSVTSIGYQAFYGCTGKLTVNCNIPSASSSWYGAFYNSKFTSVIIGDGVESIGDYAFDHCSGLTSVIIPNSVTAIGSYVFSYCSSLTSITIPNSVTSIGEHAFEYCSGLKSIEIPNSVTSIGKGAFSDCRGLQSVNIPNSVTAIGDGVFRSCSSLTSVVIPNSVTSIGGQAFYYCSKLASLTIPNSVTSIGQHAFDNTAWYNNQPNGLIYVTKVAYKYKGKMPENTSISIREGTLGIAGRAFEYCSGLTSIDIPNSVTAIGSGVFSGCSSLTSITIPNSVTSIDNDIFWGCSSLTSINVAIDNKKYDSRNNCNAIIETASNKLLAGCKNAIIPNSVTEIGDNSFKGCSGLTEFTIPNSVTKIGYGAFQSCSELTSVIIPNSVTSIGEYAFGWCYDLTEVYCYAKDVPATVSNAFSGVNFPQVTLYVPDESAAAYMSKEPWKNFGTIKTMSGETPEPPVIPETPKCATPTISYVNGKLQFDCETEGVEYVYTVTPPSYTSGRGTNISLSTTYKVTVYAQKKDYDDSDVATKDINVGGGVSGIRGDVNNDGTVSMPDAMFIVNKVLNGKFPDE